MADYRKRLSLNHMLTGRAGTAVAPALCPVARPGAGCTVLQHLATNGQRQLRAKP